MEIIRATREMQARADAIRRSGKRLAVVPTMGFLHEGHTSLIRLARERCDVVVTTIFVNPTQFAPNEDFERYPRDFARDKQLSVEAGTDILFVPEVGEMYPQGFATAVVPEGGAIILEGQFRPTHFRGVATVVAKLFNLTKPHVAVFGQKDAQQVYVVRQMIRDLNFDVELVVGPIIREPDGLARSSRNVYLSVDERKRAPVIFQSLREAERLVAGGERDSGKIREAVTSMLRRAGPVEIDYVAVVDPDTFSELKTLQSPHALIAVAVRFGPTRLIDNCLVSVGN